MPDILDIPIWKCSFCTINIVSIEFKFDVDFMLKAFRFKIVFSELEGICGTAGENIRRGREYLLPGTYISHSMLF